MSQILVACGLLWLVLGALRADTDPALREDGVLYFEDDLPDHIVAPVTAPTTLYLRRDFATPLALIVPGQSLEIIGMSPEGFLVKGDYRNNAVTGWITPAQLPPGVDPKLIDQAKKNQARHDEVAKAIQAKKVIRGMTPDEVRQSLGDPEETSSHTDDTGTAQTWTYTTYTIVWQTAATPGPYGRTVVQTFPTKVPIGQVIVTFADGAVSAIEEQKTNPDSPAVSPN
jgi:outer membrane protein assembly factor BamE (lipoprotein component of BamABCDE complex)